MNSEMSQLTSQISSLISQASKNTLIAEESKTEHKIK